MPTRNGRTSPRPNIQWQLIIGKAFVREGWKRKGLKLTVSSISLVLDSHVHSPFEETSGTEKNIHEVEAYRK